MSSETIRRRIKAGRLPNALQTADGWRIPILDLIASGLEPKSPRADEGEAQPEKATSDRHAALIAAHEEHIQTLQRLVLSQERQIEDLRRRLDAGGSCR